MKESLKDLPINRYREELIASIQDLASQDPQKPAIYTDKQTVTYHKLSETITNGTQQLAPEIRPGDLVALMLTEEVDFISMLYIVIASGGCAVPISSTVPISRLKQTLEDLKPDLLISDRIETLTQLDEQSLSSEQTNFSPSEISLKGISNSKLYLFKDLKNLASPNERRKALSDLDISIIRYSSGTTGAQKGIMLSTKKAIERINCAKEIFGVKTEDLIYCPLQATFHFVSSIMSYISCGATIILNRDISSSENSALADKITAMYASPLHYEQLLNKDINILPALRLAVSTSTLLSEKIALNFHHRFGLRLSQAYGVFEVGVPFLNQVDKFEYSDLGLISSPYEYKVISDDAGSGELMQLEESAVIGELALRGPGMYSGYLSQLGEIDHAKASDSWFFTGDLVQERENGSIIYRGRLKSIINFAGNKIIPEEVEAVIKQLPGISDCQVYGKLHPEFGEIPIAEVVVKDPSFQLGVLRKHCLKNIERYMIPTEFIIVSKIEKTESGKTRRGQIR